MVALVAGCVILSLILFSCYSSARIVPKVDNGTIDLRKWEFEKYGPVALDGNWGFVWHQLVSPPKRNLITDFLPVPQNWKGTTLSGIDITPEGYGTYSVTIRLPKMEQPVAFYLPIIAHACTIWINNKLIFQAGKVSDSREAMVPKIARNVFFLEVNEPQIDLVMQVSNFVHKSGGIDTSILFGPKEQILNLRTKNVFFEAFLTGSLVFMAILHIMIAILFTRKRASLLFAVICLDIALRNLLTGEQLLSYLIPELPWSLEYKLEYLTAFSIAMPLIASFIYDLFPHPQTKHFLTTIIGIGLLCGIFIISSPVHTFSRFLVIFDLLIIVQSIYIAFLLISAMSNRLQGSGILLSGGVILLLASVSDMLFYQQQVNIGPLAVIGFWFFLLSQAFAFSIQFMNSFNKLKRFSLNLEWQVEERTRNLQQANLKLQEEIKKKAEIEEKLRTLSRTDPLTKIDNRYRFNEILDEELRRVNRYGGSLAIIMFDIDHFKSVNDTLGHDVGDRVLISVAQLVENMIRDIDSFARWGGEEFIILTPNNDINGASMLAERIRKTIEFTDFSPIKSLTSSFGVIQYQNNEDKTSFLKRVDEALYAAKYQGRNRVVSGNPQSPGPGPR
jgi:diguanylate cyclase (GGDEF)-like protein